MKVETYLKQGQLLDQRINYKLKKLAELRNTISDIHSPVISKNRVQTSPTGDAPFVRALMRVEKMEEQINREIDTLVDLRKQIQSVIDQVEREDFRMVLVYKYLENMSFDQIAKLLHAAKATIYHWHKKAIKQIVLPDEPIIARNIH